MDTYRHYFDIDPDYFPAVNEKVIHDNPDMWEKFFPHESFVRLLKTTVSVLDRRQKLSIWVEGAYGTGKSHAVLTLKKLLDVNEQKMQDYFQKYNLDNDLLNNFKRVKNDGRILTVHRYGSSDIHGDNDLVFAVQESIEEAFRKAGIENKGRESLKEAIIRYLSDSENKQSLEIFIKGSYSTLFGGDDVDTIIDKLKTYHGAALHTLMEKIFKLSHEKQIRAFSMTVDDLINWIIETIHVNNLKSIVFMWDEFTEYFYNNTRNLTGFQKLLELSETEPFYFILVTHISSSLFHEGDKDYKKLNDRFVNPHTQISLPENIAFQLMGSAMEKNSDSVVRNEWNDIVEELADRTNESRKIVGKEAGIKEQEMLNILPIHPYTALLLKHISSTFDSNQRSMFDFIKNDRGDEIKGFQWFIDNYGPYGGPDNTDNPLLTVDMLWDFFYEKGKESLARDVRTTLDYYSRVQRRGLDTDEKRVLKAILLLQAISQHVADSVEMFIPNEKNLDLAFEGSDIENDVLRIAKKLDRDKIIFQNKLGVNNFQYNAYINEASDEELEKFKKNIDDKSTYSLITEHLNDDTTVLDALAFADGALKLRYNLKYVSSREFDGTIRKLRNINEEEGNKIPAVVCFAKNDTEATLLGKKIQDALHDGSYHLVFIDATTTPFGQDGYDQYRDDMAQSLYQTGKDNVLSEQYSRNAKEALKKWKERIFNGDVIVYTPKNITGERATSRDLFEEILKKIDREIFSKCLEGEYNVLPTMYRSTNLKQAVQCGVARKTRGAFTSSNPKTKLETALKEAWDDPVYWKNHPNILISKIKVAVDQEIQDGFKNSGRISIRAIWDMLEAAPYGFMPCNLSAFILGFVLKEYTNGEYSWSDGLTNDELTVDKLKEMIDEVIHLQITSNLKYKDKYIVTLTPEEKAFNENSAIVFGVSKNLCTSSEQTRGVVRKKMKEFPFPLWTLKELTSEIGFETASDVLNEMIDCYCGIANSGNVGSLKTENDIVNQIGKLYLDNPSATTDLKTLFSEDNCIEGMKHYLSRFEGGILLKLSNEIEDKGQYINAVREKFDADAANWVWNKDTANQKIRETIIEYQIISESNKVLPKVTSFTETIKEWCDKCNRLHMSYTAAKDKYGSISDFMKMLYEIERTGSLSGEAKKKKFLSLLQVNGSGFKQYYEHQEDLFEVVCEYYLDGFDDDEIKEIYQRIPAAGTFVMDKAAYLGMVDNTSKKYRNSLGYEQLKNFWQDKIQSSLTPREWSNRHKMPILCLVPDNEVTQAKQAFDVLNKAHPDEASVTKAKEYLEKATFYSKMDDKDMLDKIFARSIIKDYSVILTDINDVKEYLSRTLREDPYDWFGLPSVEKKIKQMAEAKYNQSGVDKALEKIDKMDADDVRRYLKELIQDNMTVGIEIIKDN